MLGGWDRTVAENLSILRTETAVLRVIVQALISNLDPARRAVALDLLNAIAARPAPFGDEAFADPDRAQQFMTEYLSGWVSALRDD